MYFLTRPCATPHMNIAPSVGASHSRVSEPKGPGDGLEHHAEADLHLAGRGGGGADATEGRHRRLGGGHAREGDEAGDAVVRAVEDVEGLEAQLDAARR